MEVFFADILQGAGETQETRGWRRRLRKNISQGSLWIADEQTSDVWAPLNESPDGDNVALAQYLASQVSTYLRIQL